MSDEHREGPAVTERRVSAVGDRRTLLPRPGGRRETDPPEDLAALLARADAEIAVAELLLEVAVVAKRLKRCPETIRRYIRAGRLKATRPASKGVRGDSYLIPEASVRAFLATTSNKLRHDDA